MSAERGSALLRAVRRRAAWFAAWVILTTLLGLPEPAHGRIIADIVTIGFPSTRSDGLGLSGAGTVRTGAWVPVVVDLRLEELPAFDGFVRVQQKDRDGDLVYDELPVNLRLDGVAQQRYTLYITANPGSERTESFQVTVLDEQRRLVEVMSGGSARQAISPEQPPDPTPDDHYMILSVSATSVGKVLDLQSGGARGSPHQYARPCAIARVDPKSLPTLWCGLETVDCVVWDDADTTQVSPEQLAALIEWTRQGGVLVLAAARTAATLRQSALNDLLPVDIGVEKRALNDMPAIRKQLLGDTETARWKSAVDVVQCKPRAKARPIPEKTESGETTLFRTSVGRGQIVFAPMSLKDLFAQAPPDSGGATQFFEKVLRLRQEEKRDVFHRTNLFSTFEKTIGFQDISAWYLVAAVLFAGVYVVVATFGTWTLLQRRRWTKHSWTAFAAIAVVASILSVVGVQSVRGVDVRKPDLRQLSIVDIWPNDVHAYATTYFGVRTSIDRTLDLWLPGDPASMAKPQPSTCTLRPMPVGIDQTTISASYADPRRYRLVPANAVIENVPFRATLKQFEGRWDGVLRGQVSASLKVMRDPQDDQNLSRRITDDSWLKNELSVPLANCFLLQPVPEGIRLGIQRENDIYVHQLGTLEPGQRVNIAPRIYSTPDGREIEFKDWSAQRTLKKAQNAWSAAFPALANLTDRKAPRFNLEAYQDALMLLTTLSDFRPEPNTNMSFGGIGESEFSRARARQLDISEQIDERHALLVGFCEDAGPVRLYYGSGDGEYAPVAPKRAWTAYRVLIALSN